MLGLKIEKTIRDTFNVNYLELENESHMHSGEATESHFKLTLVSNDFEGVAKVKRHQLIYKALNQLMPLFHALALHLYTQEEWSQIKQRPDSPACMGDSRF